VKSFYAPIWRQPIDKSAIPIMSIPEITSVFFDLDGTLIDTAPDLAHALNRVRIEHGLDALAYPLARQLMTYGSNVLMTHCFGDSLDDEDFHRARNQFLDYYEERLRHRSYVFHPFRELLQRMNDKQIPWGIVTNKPSRFTLPVIKGLHIPIDPHFVISGDTADKPKPHADPIHLLCQRLNIDPAGCLFVGDSMVDMQAGANAGTLTGLAMWGYIQAHDFPHQWPANFRFSAPQDCFALLKRQLLR